jgi:hypothetical protein
MSLRGICSVVFASALVSALPVYAVDTSVLPGSHRAAVSGPSGINSPGDSGFEQSGEPDQGETRARSEPDWLTIPPDPARHNLWVPTAEWATCLALTIPLFTLAPSFVHTGTVSTNQFVEAWTRPPAWDTDGPVANYVLHPIMGAEAYLTVRNRDYGPLESSCSRPASPSRGSTCSSRGPSGRAHRTCS